MTIKDIFSQVSVSLVLDLLLAILTGIALIQINLPLSLLTLSVVIIDVILIYVFKGSYKRINYDQMEAGAVMNSSQADRLQVCRVDAGQGEPLQIVCGAPNARVGIKVPLAAVGAKLPRSEEHTSEL